MSEIDDGGPAFPRPQAETSAGGNYEQDGMTLRDWFAGQGIGAVIRQCAPDLRSMHGHENLEDYFASKAYAVADAMLKARKGATS